MMNKDNHPYHMVDFSPWPLIISGTMIILVTSFLEMVHFHNFTLLFIALALISLISFQWWRDVSRESKYQGLHLSQIVLGLKWGMILFILSEILFFVSFFWTFFHMSLSPNFEMGNAWPPLGVSPFSYMEIPLLNTLILLSSGISITWAHKALITNKLSQATSSLGLTIILGGYFTFLQALEYVEASYSFADSSFGASFFLATGFHGLHIIVGSIFLLTMFIRMVTNSFSESHHFGFEASSWYWHFVDVVWLFLYSFIYWWAII